MSQATPQNEWQDPVDTIDGVLSEMGTEDEAILGAVISNVAAAINQNDKHCDQVIKKMTAKITKELNSIEVKDGNDLDATASVVIQAINWDALDCDAILCNVASAGGVLAPGMPLESALKTEDSSASPLSWGGTLLLDCKCLEPHIKELVDVLREIRDVLASTTIALPTHPAPTEIPIDVGSFDLTISNDESH